MHLCQIIFNLFLKFIFNFGSAWNSKACQILCCFWICLGEHYITSTEFLGSALQHKENLFEK